MKKIKNVNIIFTSPNQDEGNQIITGMIKKFIRKNEMQILQLLGHKLYFSVLKNIDCVIGNSSSALSEAPFLGAMSINVGNRQKFRVQPGRVINVEANSNKIEKKINFILKKKKKI